jgi:cation diffusion facilitator CzcD-associated flavoprotein CzcO
MRGTIEIPQTTPHQPLEQPRWDERGNDEKDDEPPPTFPSPMYEGLETNIPHLLMQFSDAPALTRNQLCPSREATLRYLREYADDLKHMIMFRTQVTDVRQITEDGHDRWSVRYRDLNTNEAAEGLYDAIVVASGHYSVPYIPDIPGIREWNMRYPGTISHSKFYQRPQDFADKKVLVVGYAASGRDIAGQLATFSKIPIIISQRSSVQMTQGMVTETFMPEIVEFLVSPSQVKAVRFRNGHVESNLDALIFCTGYLYSYPFLSTIRPSFIGTGERVQHLYHHIFSINHPSLAFVGLPRSVVPFPTCEGQAAVIARVWSGRLALPSACVMQEWENAVLMEQGGGKKFHVLRFPKDFDYHNALVEWSLQAEDSSSGKLPKKWNSKDRWIRERCPAVKRAFMERGEDRHRVMTMEELEFLEYENSLHKEHGCGSSI